MQGRGAEEKRRRRRRSWGQGQWLAGGGGGCSINTGAARLPGRSPTPALTHQCQAVFPKEKCWHARIKLVHLFNSRLVKFGSDDPIVCPICPKIESQTRIIGKLVILIKCPENCQHIILPLPSFSNIIDTTKNSFPPKIPLESRFF